MAPLPLTLFEEEEQQQGEEKGQGGRLNCCGVYVMANNKLCRLTHLLVN